MSFPTLQAILAFSSHLQFAARNSILIYKTCTESGHEHWLVNLHTMLSDLTLTFISRGKNAKNQKTAYHYKLEVEWQP